MTPSNMPFLSLFLEPSYAEFDISGNVLGLIFNQGMIWWVIQRVWHHLIWGVINWNPRLSLSVSWGEAGKNHLACPHSLPSHKNWMTGLDENQDGVCPTLGLPWSLGGKERYREGKQKEEGGRRRKEGSGKKGKSREGWKGKKRGGREEKKERQKRCTEGLPPLRREFEEVTQLQLKLSRCQWLDASQYPTLLI